MVKRILGLELMFEKGKGMKITRKIPIHKQAASNHPKQPVYIKKEVIHDKLQHYLFTNHNTSVYYSSF